MEDSIIFQDQYQLNHSDYSLDCLNFQSFHESYYPQSIHQSRGSRIEDFHAGVEKPAAKQQKTNSWNSCTSGYNSTSEASHSSSPPIPSFEDIKSQASFQNVYGLDCAMNTKKDQGGSQGNINSSSSISLQGFYENPHFSRENVQETKGVGPMTKTPLYSEHHLIAERKRREKLNQRLIALSALIPGLKKKDKVSVLGDACKHVKQLQERVKELEEQAAKKTMETVIVVRKSQLCIDDENSSSDENFNGQSNQYLLNIEARVSDRDVLIRIHCDKNKGCVVNILSEIEKLRLTIVNSNILPLGNSILDITVVAQMNVEFSMTVMDLVKNLRLTLLKSM